MLYRGYWIVGLFFLLEVPKPACTHSHSQQSSSAYFSKFISFFLYFLPLLLEDVDFQYQFISLFF